jgi:predicted nuclease of predicted toxin-antitoxin system
LRFHANIESEIVEFLRASGHDVAYSAELTPRAPDDLVLKLATAEDRIVLTAAKDFGELCFRRRLPSAGVVLLRARDVSPTARIRMVDDLLRTRAEATILGHFTVLSESGVRTRSLRAP